VRISDARRVSEDSFSINEERQSRAASGKADVHPFLGAEVKQEASSQFVKEPTIADIHQVDMEKTPCANRLPIGTRRRWKRKRSCRRMNRNGGVGAGWS